MTKKEGIVRRAMNMQSHIAVQEHLNVAHCGLVQVHYRESMIRCV